MVAEVIYQLVYSGGIEGASVGGCVFDLEIPVLAVEDRGEVGKFDAGFTAHGLYPLVCLGKLLDRQPVAPRIGGGDGADRAADNGGVRGGSKDALDKLFIPRGKALLRCGGKPVAADVNDKAFRLVHHGGIDGSEL